MKFALGSDLHLDQNVLNCPHKNSQGADILILAGDICDLTNIRYDHTGIIETPKRVAETIKWFQRISIEFPLIFWVFGNHEYYEGDLSTARAEYQKFLNECGVSNVIILEDESYTVDGIEIVGSTLWTNFKNRDPQIMWDCQRGMSDYRFITIDGRRLTAQDIADKHDTSIDYIRNKIENTETELVIVTHHQPTWFKAKLEHGVGTINYAYYSEFADLIIDNSKRIPYWLSGHTHTNRDDYLEYTRLVTNCRGYYGYETMANTFDFKYFYV